MSIFFLGMATLLAGASCFWVLGRRKPRPAGTWAMGALLSSFAVFLATYAPLVERTVESAVPHGTRILGDSASLGATTAVLAVSLQLNQGPARARQLIGSRLKWTAIALAGIGCLFVYEQATGQSAHVYALYSLLYISVVGATDINFVVQALRQATTTRRTTVRVGLRTAAVGSGVALIHLSYKTVRLVHLGLGAELNGDGERCTSLSAVRCAVGVTSPALAVALICLGLTLPAVIYPIRHMRRRHWEKASFEALTPLWRDLAKAMPHIVLSPARPLTENPPEADTAFHLQRRVVEISDGILALRPYRSRESQEAARKIFDARTEQGSAQIEAAVVRAALANLAASQLASDIAPPAQTTSRRDLDADAQWLVHVAHAYASQSQKWTVSATSTTSSSLPRPRSMASNSQNLPPSVLFSSSRRRANR
ncbi:MULTISPECIES: MAB_1171c family putative transporter [unclassified Streptomyces]|uniref:MAB_1171c family putative transporter n=1 Tax=unclassified Streptomyces TaxID=2593676 RepID=UPI0018F2CB73|nr:MULTISPECIES: MAB_1171c family putative transporter [unclassified Streptomyces]